MHTTASYILYDILEVNIATKYKQRRLDGRLSHILYLPSEESTIIRARNGNYQLLRRVSEKKVANTLKI